jgi:predicted GNAT family acetyltransferase
MTELLHSPETDYTPSTTQAPMDIDDALLELTPREVAALTTRHLRVLINRAYTIMDTDYPPAGAVDCYDMIVDELDHRAQQATKRGNQSKVKEAFRDNALYRRFELFIGGDLAAYVRYTMLNGHVALIEGIEQPGYRDQGIDATLMRHIVLNTHKRRLSLTPQCPMAFSFLADHPQYQTLTTHR